MITKEIKEEFIQEELAYLATADKDGNPNIGPKRTMRYLDENRSENVYTIQDNSSL